MSLSNRLQKLRQSLAEKELNGILISQPENRFYLSGFDGSAGYLFITQQDTVLATDFRYVEQALQQTPDYRVFQITSETSKWFPELLSELKVSKLAFESGYVTVALYKLLTDILSKANLSVQFVPIEGLVESLRTIKEPEELELITRAVAISDKAIEHIKDWIHAGMTEREVGWEIEKFMREKGSQPLPFDVIVAAGPNAALPHHKPGEKQIKSGEPVIIDIGARVGGYASDLTRTICLGTPDDTYKKVYDTVLGAQLTAEALIKEGMTGEEADRLARVVIEEAGHGQAFGHSLGHGIGLATHELPRVGPKSTDVLASGMVFSVEPGIYLSGWGGVRIEDLAALEDGKIKVLSKAPK
ncbi:MAG: aminopeptidase P family protein [Chloroflexi bacterium]|nr:aminopeptidase P family protein [Chloroflexota bacterium]